MTIQITDGPSLCDPHDVAPIQVLDGLGRDGVVVAAIGWRVRLAVWFLRRYVRRCVGA